MSLYHITSRATALAILAEENGMNALQRNKNPTPLHLLVEEMPGETSHFNIYIPINSAFTLHCMNTEAYCS